MNRTTPPQTSNLIMYYYAHVWELTTAPACSPEACSIHTVWSVVHTAHHAERRVCVELQREH